MRTAVFKLCGQPEIGPMGVLDQSNARILSPSSPPPEKTSSGVCPSLEIEDAWLTGRDSGCTLRIVKEFVGESYVRNLSAETKDSII